MNPRKADRIVPLILGVAMTCLSFPAHALDTVVPVPEPGTLALLLGAAGVAVLVWRNRKK